MRPNYKVMSTGRGSFVLVTNFPYQNEVHNFRYSTELFSSINRDHTVGMWKPKSKK